MYLTIKFIHVTCAILSISGFTIRGVLIIKKQANLTGFLFKALPHIIDTLLLITAISLVILSQQFPISTPWITTKIIALVVYIGLGICFMRLARTKPQQILMFTLALTTAGYIVLVALTKSSFPIIN